MDASSQAVAARPVFLTHVRQIVSVVAWSIFCAISFGVVLGALWAMIDYIRYYGTGFVPPAYLAHETRHQYPAGSFMGNLEDLISLYNTTVKQAARFGSGIGMITGLFFSWGYAKRCAVPARVCAGIVSGALVGGRLMLMLTPEPSYFLVGSVGGAIVATVYLIREGGRRRLQPLPMLRLGKKDG